jgi:hypothetical protein
MQCQCYNEYKGNRCQSLAKPGDFKCQRHAKTMCQLVLLPTNFTTGSPINEGTAEFEGKVQHMCFLLAMVMRDYGNPPIFFTSGQRLKADVTSILKQMKNCVVYHDTNYEEEKRRSVGRLGTVALKSSQEEVQHLLYHRFPRMNLLQDPGSGSVVEMQDKWTSDFDSAALRKEFKVYNPYYEDFFLREGFLAPSIHVYTPLVIYPGNKVIKVLNLTPYLFDYETRHDVRAMKKENERDVIKRILRLFTIAFYCAKEVKATNIYFPNIFCKRLFYAMPNLLQSLLKSLSKNISKEAITFYSISASDEADLLILEETGFRIDKVELFSKAIFLQFLQNKDSDLLLFVNAWNPYTTSGQLFILANGTSANVDGVVGSCSDLTILSTSLTNPYLYYHLHYVPKEEEEEVPLSVEVPLKVPLKVVSEEIKWKKNPLFSTIDNIDLLKLCLITTDFADKWLNIFKKMPEEVKKELMTSVEIVRDQTITDDDIRGCLTIRTSEYKSAYETFLKQFIDGSFSYEGAYAEQHILHGTFGIFGKTMMLESKQIIPTYSLRCFNFESPSSYDFKTFCGSYSRGFTWKDNNSAFLFTRMMSDNISQFYRFLERKRFYTHEGEKEKDEENTTTSIVWTLIGSNAKRLRCFPEGRTRYLTEFLLPLIMLKHMEFQKEKNNVRIAFLLEYPEDRNLIRMGNAEVFTNIVDLEHHIKNSIVVTSFDYTTLPFESGNLDDRFWLEGSQSLTHTLLTNPFIKFA